MGTSNLPNPLTVALNRLSPESRLKPTGEGTAPTAK